MSDYSKVEEEFNNLQEALYQVHILRKQLMKANNDIKELKQLNNEYQKMIDYLEGQKG